MSRKPTSKRTRPKRKAVLRLPDLDQAKSAVLNSLTSGDANVDTDTQLMNRGLVLLRTEAVFQQDCCAPLSNSSRRSEARSRNSQSSLRSGATLGL
jgi:hypothetical protein